MKLVLCPFKNVVIEVICDKTRFFFKDSTLLCFIVNITSAGVLKLLSNHDIFNYNAKILLCK